MAEYLIQDSTLTAIADAIRSKTSKTDTITVADMPEEISSIETGTGANRTLIFRSGQITPTSANVTVQHNCGVIPDIVIVASGKTISDTSKLQWAIGYSTAMLNALDNAAGCVINLPGGTNMSTTALTGIDGSIYAGYGFIKNATESSFTVGGTSYHNLASGVTYYWYAIAGIV